LIHSISVHYQARPLSNTFSLIEEADKFNKHILFGGRGRTDEFPMDTTVYSAAADDDDVDEEYMALTD
jgi:hypothetical protein